MPSMPSQVLFVTQPLASIFSLNGHARYVHVGWFLISVANLVIVVLMIVVFVLAIVVPFPHERKRS
jgi:hypothetical protein